MREMERGEVERDRKGLSWRDRGRGEKREEERKERSTLYSGGEEENYFNLLAAQCFF